MRSVSNLGKAQCRNRGLTVARTIGALADDSSAGGCRQSGNDGDFESHNGVKASWYRTDD